MEIDNYLIAFCLLLLGWLIMSSSTCRCKHHYSEYFEPGNNVNMDFANKVLAFLKQPSSYIAYSIFLNNSDNMYANLSSQTTYAVLSASPNLTLDDVIKQCY